MAGAAAPSVGAGGSRAVLRKHRRMGGRGKHRPCRARGAHRKPIGRGFLCHAPGRSGRRALGDGGAGADLPSNRSPAHQETADFVADDTRHLSLCASRRLVDDDLELARLTSRGTEARERRLVPGVGEDCLPDAGPIAGITAWREPPFEARVDRLPRQLRAGARVGAAEVFRRRLRAEQLKRTNSTRPPARRAVPTPSRRATRRLDMSPECQVYDGRVKRTVQEVAARVGLRPRTIRYYDRIGLVKATGRSEAGYRLYSAEDEGRLRFVRQARSLGFSLEEVRQLLAAAEEGCCGRLVPELDRLLRAKLAELDERIAELKEFRGRLAAYAEGRGSACGCAGHGAFCGCLDDAPELLTMEKEGRRWPASAVAGAPAAPRSARSSATRMSFAARSSGTRRRSSDV